MLITWSDIKKKFPVYSQKYKKEFHNLFSRLGRLSITSKEIERVISETDKQVPVVEKPRFVTFDELKEMGRVSHSLNKKGEYVSYFYGASGEIIGRTEIDDQGNGRAFSAVGDFIGSTFGGTTLNAKGEVIAHSDILSSLLITEKRIMATKKEAASIEELIWRDMPEEDRSIYIEKFLDHYASLYDLDDFDIELYVGGIGWNEVPFRKFPKEFQEWFSEKLDLDEEGEIKESRKEARRADKYDYFSLKMDDIEEEAEEGETKPSVYIPKYKQLGEFHLYDIVSTPEGRGRIVRKQTEYQPFSYTVKLSNDDIIVVEEDQMKRLEIKPTSPVMKPKRVEEPQGVGMEEFLINSVTKKAGRDEVRLTAGAWVDLWVDGDALRYDDRIIALQKENISLEEKIEKVRGIGGIASQIAQETLDLAVNSKLGVQVNANLFEIDADYERIDWESLFVPEKDEEDGEIEASKKKADWEEFPLDLIGEQVEVEYFDSMTMKNAYGIGIVEEFLLDGMVIVRLLGGTRKVVRVPIENISTREVYDEKGNVVEGSSSKKKFAYTSSEVRSVVKRVLEEKGLSNKFKIRTVSFSDLARGSSYVITILDWKPSPVAQEIKDALRPYGIVEFEGSGIVQGSSNKVADEFVKEKLQNLFHNNIHELEHYNVTSKIVDQLGFSNAKEAWEANPMVEVVVNEEAGILTYKKIGAKVGWLKDLWLDQSGRIMDVVAEVSDEFHKERDEKTGPGLALFEYYAASRYDEVEKPLREDSITKSQAKKLIGDLLYQYKTELFATYGISANTKEIKQLEREEGVETKEEDSEKEIEKESHEERGLVNGGPPYPYPGTGAGFPSSTTMGDISDETRSPEVRYIKL